MSRPARRCPTLVLALLLSTRLSPELLHAQVAARPGAPTPPVAALVAHVDTVAGVEWPDPYAWLRDDKRQRPEVLAYLSAENDYTAAMTRHTMGLQERLFKEMVGHIKETDLSVPELDHGYYYYTRTVKGQQYPIFCRKRGSLSAPEQILLDENALGRGHGYSRVGVRQVSPNGKLLAYTQDTTGSEWYTVYVKDLRTGKLLPDKIDSVSYGLEWAADNRTLFFTRDNAAHRPDRILRRALGDTVVVQVVSEPDSLYFLGLSKTKDRAYLLAESRSYTTGEVRYLPAGQPAAEWQVLLPRREGVEYSAEHHGDGFLVRGGSAGGLLMGAVTNMRPDLFRVVIADVPFVDLINTMRDPSLEFTTQEWQQWGNPSSPDQFAYMRSYSPYDNVARKDYPAILVTAGLNDPRVNYWEPAKWVARLRATKTDDNPLLFKINMGAGHGGRSGRYEYLHDEAFRYAFIVDLIGTGPGGAVAERRALVP